MQYTIIFTHIDDIKPGDTVEVEGVLHTVTASAIKKGGFMGTTLWGDSYRSGRKQVKKAVIYHAKPELSKETSNV